MGLRLRGLGETPLTALLAPAKPRKQRANECLPDLRQRQQPLPGNQGSIFVRCWRPATALALAELLAADVQTLARLLLVDSLRLQKQVIIWYPKAGNTAIDVLFYALRNANRVTACRGNLTIRAHRSYFFGS